MSGLPLAWGATRDEVERHYPADDLIEGRVLAMTRSASVAAPPMLCWRWLCQIALAPYSYDLLDNLGRRSPRHLVPGTEDLVLGQRMTVFRLTSFEPGHQWTGEVPAGGLFGQVAVTYAAEPHADGTRLVCRILVPSGGVRKRVRGYALAWGDLVMMRKQLLTLKAYAERDART